MRTQLLVFSIALCSAANPAHAGRLLSATLDHSFRVGPAPSDVVSLQVSALNPSGLLSGGLFTLDAGSAFATTVSRPGMPAPAGTVRCAC